MTSVYGPTGTLDSLATNKLGSTATSGDHAGHHNDLADAVNKVERGTEAVFNVRDSRFAGGAVGDGVNDDTAAIQAAIDAADRYLGKVGATHTYTTGERGGKVFFPPTKDAYLISASLYTDARIRLVGHLANKAGGQSSRILASSGGTYTNGDYTEKFMVKMGRDPRTAPYLYWWHSGSLEGLELDCNNTAGLSGFHCWGAGENSLIERVRVLNSGITARTVSDAVFNNTATVTSASAAFTQDDVAAKVTSPSFPTYSTRTFTDAVTTARSPTVTSATASFTGADQGAAIGSNTAGFPRTAYILTVNSATSVTLSHTATADQTGKSITLEGPRDFRIQRVVNGTTVVLTRPVPVGSSGNSLTINRPRPGVQFHGGHATMLIRSLNVYNNSGAGLEIVNGYSQNDINVTGDNNGGALLRLTQAASGADPANYNVSFKAESNTVGDQEAYGDHDPVILIDNSGMVNVNASGAAFAGQRGSNHLVRIDQSNVYSAGYPTLTLQGIEASNPYNFGYDWLIYDTANAKGVPAGNIAVSARFYPTVHWNKDVIIAGVQGGFWNNTNSLRVASASGTYTMDGTIRIVAITSTNTPRQVTLPLASTVPPGELFTIKDEGGNASVNSITVGRQGSDAVDGQVSGTINTNYGVKQYYSSGANWFSV